MYNEKDLDDYIEWQKNSGKLRYELTDVIINNNNEIKTEKKIAWVIDTSREDWKEFCKVTNRDYIGEICLLVLVASNSLMNHIVKESKNNSLNVNWRNYYKMTYNIKDSILIIILHENINEETKVELYSDYEFIDKDINNIIFKIHLDRLLK